MQNKDKDDGIKDSLVDMLLVILLEGASKVVVVVVTPSSVLDKEFLTRHPNFMNKSKGFFLHATDSQILS